MTEKTKEIVHAAWQSPSNIALVKYWGKKGVQIPANSSVSFTLSQCVTRTKVSGSVRTKSASSSTEVFLAGLRKPEFDGKVNKFIEFIRRDFPVLEAYDWRIDTENTFPHGSGIASSASGMSALALCFCSILDQMGESATDFFQRASHYARLGSGSACRSVYGPASIWGEHKDFAGSSDLYGMPLEVHPLFRNFRDTILIVHEGEKDVSSTVGHDLVHQTPFAQARFEHANNQISNVLNILTSGDIEAFIPLVESEAMMLHAMMMSAHPYFILMKPNTLAIIEKIRDYRKQKSNSFVFTLDAGANVHFMYSEEDEKDALRFVADELVGLCEKGRYICDQVGNGPEKLI